MHRAGQKVKDIAAKSAVLKEIILETFDKAPKMTIVEGCLLVALRIAGTG